MASERVVELDRGPTTEPNVVNYRRELISHHTLQFDHEMGRYCCAEKARKTPQNGDFLIFVQFVRDPFIKRFRLSYLFEVDGNCHWR